MSKPQKDSNISIPESVLKQLLTQSEWRMLKNRWKIMQMVEEGKTIRKISTSIGVGTDTVVRTIKMMENSGFDKKSKQNRKFKSLTPWIFGKSDE